MASIHCAVDQRYLLALIVPALLGRHLAIGLGLAAGVVVLGKCTGQSLCGMGDLGSTQYQ